MTSRLSRELLIGAAFLVLAGCNKTTNTSEKMAASENAASAATAQSTASSSDPVQSAESAAPASIAHNASIATMDAKGNMTVVRKGSNGWTCIPDSPATPGPDPMCMDGNAMKWADAWIHHKPPPPVVGVMYMLEGGTDASNTDPYATQPTAQNDWIKTGPHIMVVGSKEVLAGYPAGGKPDTTAPYVMWAGTPYEHLMVPIGK
jgi:hypothetical protein